MLAELSNHDEGDSESEGGMKKGSVLKELSNQEKGDVERQRQAGKKARESCVRYAEQPQQRRCNEQSKEERRQRHCVLDVLNNHKKGDAVGEERRKEGLAVCLGRAEQRQQRRRRRGDKQE